MHVAPLSAYIKVDGVTSLHFMYVNGTDIAALALLLYMLPVPVYVHALTSFCLDEEVSSLPHAVIAEEAKECVMEEGASTEKGMAKQKEDKKAAQREKSRIKMAAKRADQTKEQRELANEKEKIRKRKAAERKEGIIALPL